MAEPTRDQLDEEAKGLGLKDAENYVNKPAVADAINRVKAGEPADAVNKDIPRKDSAEQSSAAPAPASAPPAQDDAPQAAPAAEQAARPAEPAQPIRSKDGGSPTQFDATGNPVYDPSEI